jgi:3-oxoacyl-[acyl-carrier protein] reductase
MDLGIAGRSAIICASSRGLGRACAEALAGAGVDIVINGRDATALAITADEFRARFGVKITAVAADATTPDGRAELLNACPKPDILINNAAGPPPGDWRTFEPEQWHAAVDSNMLAGIMMIRDVVDGMADRGFGRIVNITSALVKMPAEVISLSVAARLGLTGFVRGIAGSYVARGVTMNNLLPEEFDTERLKKNIAFIAEKSGNSVEEQTRIHHERSPAKRFGRPEEFGATCAFVCSNHAGYMTGQNILLDGGRYPGVF